MPRDPPAAPARSTTRASDNEMAKGPNPTIPVLILGIETSCDETAAAVVEDGVAIRSSVVASQLAHGKYGGVVPELASREHLRAIVTVVRQALEQSGAGLHQLAAIAVTEGPGLVGSLLVGITYAKSLCFARNIPLIAVNHIEGHIHAVILEAGTKIEFPALALVVSGGHTHLFEVRRRVRLSPARQNARRRSGRSLRQGSEAARLRLSRAAPSSTNSRPTAIPAPSNSRSRA